MDKIILILSMVFALLAFVRALDTELPSRSNYWLAASSFFLAVLAVQEYRISKVPPEAIGELVVMAPWHTMLTITVIFLGVWSAYSFADLKVSSPVQQFLSAFLMVFTTLYLYLMIFIGNGWFVSDIDHIYTNGRWYCKMQSEGLNGFLFHGWLIWSNVLYATFFFFAYREEPLPRLRSLKFVLFLVFTILPAIYLLYFVFYSSGEPETNYLFSPFILVIILVTVLVYTNMKFFDLGPVNIMDHLLDSVESLVILVDANLFITYTNNAFKEEVKKIGQKVPNRMSLPHFLSSIGVSFEEGPGLLEQMDRMVAGDRIEQELKIMIAGEKRYFYTTLTPVFRKDHIRIGFVIVGKDITLLKEDEKRLQEYAIELKQSNIALERFAYIASHDLKTPVRNINSFAHLLDRRIKKLEREGLREYTNSILENASYLHQQIQEILDHSHTVRSQKGGEVEKIFPGNPKTEEDKE